MQPLGAGPAYMELDQVISFNLKMKNPLHDELFRLKPEGEAPLRCDKTACWSYEDKVYIFGGFGPPPTTQLGMQGNLSRLSIDLYLYFE